MENYNTNSTDPSYGVETSSSIYESPQEQSMYSSGSGKCSGGCRICTGRCRG